MSSVQENAARTQYGFIPSNAVLPAPGELEEHYHTVGLISRKGHYSRVKCFTSSQARELGLKGGKIVHFVRHGEGVHNAAALLRGNEAYSDPALLDAVLTEKGSAMASELRDYTKELNVKTVFVSPLRRASQTALLAFGPDKVYVAQEELREQIGKHLCDKRLPVRELALEFPKIDYSKLESDDDILYSDEREPKDKMADRIDAFLKDLRMHEEDEVAVVGHSSWLLALFCVNLEHTIEYLKTFFFTGELRTAVLFWED